MTQHQRAVTRQKLFDLAREAGIPTNEVLTLIAERQDLLDKFAMGAMRSLLAKGGVVPNDTALAAQAYEQAEHMMAERARRYHNRKPA